MTGHSCSCRCHHYFISWEESRTVQAPVKITSCCVSIDETHLPNDDAFPLCCVQLLNLTEQLCSCSQYNVNMYEMYLLSVLVTGNGRGGNQPFITQQSFKTVLPKLFSLFFSFLFFFCTSLFRQFAVTVPPLLPCLLDKILPWPLCGCGGHRLDWLPSRLMLGAQYRDTPDLFVLLVSAMSQIETVWKGHGSGLKVFTWSAFSYLKVHFWSIQDFILN